MDLMATNKAGAGFVKPGQVTLLAQATLYLKESLSYYIFQNHSF